MKSPYRLELPGPPLSHIDSGAFSGSFRASKNQKKVLIGYSCSSPKSASDPGGKCTYPAYDFAVVSQIPGLEEVSSKYLI